MEPRDDDAAKKAGRGGIGIPGAKLFFIVICLV